MILLNCGNTARLAISNVTFAVDRPYSYLIPEELSGKVRPGVRVTVPFGRSNRRSEGIVLTVSSAGPTDGLKSIAGVLDDEPVFTEEQIKLALWMRDRFFCTVYDAAHVMLPSGMWFKRDGARRVSDKTVTTAVLTVTSEDAQAIYEKKKRRAPAQAAVLELLSQIDALPVSDICSFTGASRSVLKALEKQGLLKLEQHSSLRRPSYDISEQADDLILNKEQAEAYDSLSAMMRSGKPEAALLYGVTGSGKTAVYIRLIQLALELGRTSIVLVPEIALTPQLMHTFTSYFGDDVAVLHSSLGTGERCDEWKRIKSGRVHVVVGTRSAVFAPVSNLGLLILDEEQEHTYKSESTPRYHARDIAKFRCARSNALMLLGSATPSMESMYSAKKGTYSLLRLTGRYNETEMPPVIIADMRKELKNGNGGDVSSVLRSELELNLERGEQSIIFINRRGANTLVTCGECGHVFECPHCSVAMTYHSYGSRLMCHYCGHSEGVPEVCPECGGRLKFVGTGTQRVETELREMFPGTDIVRMDADTVSAVGSHEQLLRRFRKEKIPILLGTQMVTKGLDIENVTLVGVIEADKSLYMNDFRAHERTFSMLTQVVGRSGRGAKPGRAVIQTFTPDNEVIRLAAKQDYDAFYEREMKLRELIGCPPVCDMFALSVSGPDESAVITACSKARSALDGYLGTSEKPQILGPAPAHITRVNDRFRYRIIVFGENSKKLRDTLAHIVREISRDKSLRSVSAYADLNPLD